MKYGKKYSFNITIMGQHWFAAALCLLLSLFVLVSFGNRYGRAVTQFCDCAIYFALIYSAANKFGERDKNLFLSGKGQRQIFKGLKAGLFAGGINIFYSLFLIIFKIFGVEPGIYLVIYRFIINPFYMPANLTLLQTSLSIVEIPMINVILSVMLTFVMPVIAMLGYIIGFGQTDIKELLMFSDSSDVIKQNI